jgi:hypothetical protein
MKLFVPPPVSLKSLFFKSVAFMIPWTIALAVVNHGWPHLIETEKIVTNIFSNSLVFLLGYILTMIGFRYTSKDEKRKREDEEAIPTHGGSARVVMGTEPEL